MTNQLFSDEEKNKIINHYGIDFYEKLLNDIRICTDRWKLRELSFVPYYSVNCIFLCQSELYGDVALKIGKPCKEIFTEFSILKEYDGNKYCKAYDADIDNGHILLEQIQPGKVLREVKELDQRLAFFSSLYHNLYIEPQDPEKYPTYIHWVSRITEYMSKQAKYQDLYLHMKRAKEICLSLVTVYNRNLLLHGDIHHDNILLGQNNEYKIIDPKGVIGDPIFDISQFILNEYEDEISDALYNKINYIIDFFEDSLSIPKEFIRKCLYIQTTMSECWNVESGFEASIKYVQMAEKIMKGEC